MKITYSNKKTEKICENFSKAINELGKDVATKLVDLLNAIRAFPTLYDIYCFPQYRMHPLKANRKYQYSLTIHKNYKWRLVVYPLDGEGKVLTNNDNEKAMLMKAVMVEVLEVSEHYE